VTILHKVKQVRKPKKVKTTHSAVIKKHYVFHRLINCT